MTHPTLLPYTQTPNINTQQHFKPAIIIVESNAFIRPDLAQPLTTEASSNNLQQSLTVFRQVAELLGYRLVSFTQNALLVRADLAHNLSYPRSVNRLYHDALVINWNDMLLNVEATRSGVPPELVAAETAQFGDFSAKVDLDELLKRAVADEADQGALADEALPVLPAVTLEPLASRRSKLTQPPLSRPQTIPTQSDIGGSRLAGDRAGAGKGDHNRMYTQDMRNVLTGGGASRTAPKWGGAS